MYTIKTTDPKVIWKRKQEVKFNVLKKQVKTYGSLSRKLNNCIVCRNYSDTKKIIKFIEKNYEI